MKKNRYAKILWNKIPAQIDEMMRDLSLNEVFVPYSFEDWNMKHIDSRKSQILDMLIEALKDRRNNDSRYSIAWISLSYVSNSSIFVFDF